MSRLSIIILRDQQVGILSTFRQKKNEHVNLLKRLKQKTKDCQEFQMSNALLLKKLEDFEPFGQISLINGFVFARKFLNEQPIYLSKVFLFNCWLIISQEVFLLTCSNSSLDKADLLKEIQRYKQLKIEINVISFCASAKIFENMTRETKGQLYLPKGNFSILPKVSRCICLLT
jgi:homoaconitase/3-isopropylmalate dehydratase large subunit